MKDVLLLLLVLIGLVMLWVLPIYICVNLLLIAFHVSYHVTIWQTILAGVLVLLIKTMISPENKGGK